MNGAAQKLLLRVENARGQLVDANLPDKAIAICIAGLERMERVLAKAPRVAILGEFNSGKTSVADLLLGNGLLPTSVVANTHVPVLLRYSDRAALFAVTQNGRQPLTEYGPDELPSGLELRALEIGLPSDRLLDFQILDTPSIAEAGDMVAEAEILIWCTVATRAWTESERAVWSSLPPRCWRNGLLVATHRDSLQDASDVAKIEQRLRAVTAPMFRDVILVSAADAGQREEGEESLSPDSGVGNLLQRVGAIADEIQERRALKAEKIIRRLARLTFHHLDGARLKPEATHVVKEWQARSSELIGRLGEGSPDLSGVVEGLLVEFAISLSGGRSSSSAGADSRAVTTTAGWTLAPLAAQRFARLLTADLTALLHVELARRGMQEAATDADYRQARSVLMSLADLDGAFDALGRILLSGRTAPAATGAPGAQGSPVVDLPSHF